ncbi:DUF2213 domain-containing protein [Pseudomonas asiatica]|uniref:DUF2213 domain-containing protein n=1 Tax=Pseudomonas asiatica TaxID=2219225 RepID=UPI00207B6BF5|nr:DUF2213 domain-containing protein [Pseudomonas asiatica]
MGRREAPDGTKYQAKQTNIIADHIAIVQRGRAGSRASIGDSWPQHTQPRGKTHDPEDGYRRRHPG